MSKRLLIICGPTATGKTSLGVKLAKQFDGEIISADSRQVYKHMDVITGKDLPTNPKFTYRNSKLGGYYNFSGVRVWCYDLADPDQEFRVSLYRKFSVNIIADIHNRKKIPIVVGGTGLYIDSIVKPLNKIDIPKDDKLRSELNKLGVNDLYRRLLRINAKKALSMNPSDRSNPRRLIRAIEIAGKTGEFVEKSKTDKVPEIKFDEVLWIGLTKKPRKLLNKAIDERVSKRITPRMFKEIDYLKEHDFLRYAPSRTIGYKQWISYLKGDYTKAEALEKWKTAEHNYAKRQLTWFRRNNNIIWFDVGMKNYRENIEKEVRKWYSTK